MSKPVLVFGPTGPLPPSLPRRNLNHAIACGLFGFAAGAAGVSALLWRSLPGSTHVPPGNVFAQFVGYPGLLLNGLSGGALFPNSWFDNPAADIVPQSALHLRLLPAWLSAIAGGIWMGRRALIPYTGLQHLDGTHLFEGDEAVQRVAQWSKNACRARNTPGFLHLHPQCPIPKAMLTRHILVMGSVGSGKTQVCYPIICGAIEKQAKVFAVDSKGDYTQAFGDALILSPWDKRSVYWDIALDVCTPALADAFASGMVPAETGTNEFFSIATQLVLAGCLRALQATRGTHWTWQDLDVLTSSPVDLLVQILTEHYPKAAPLLSGSDVTSASVMATLAAYTRTIHQLAVAFTPLAENGKPRLRFSLRAWARDDYQGPRVVIAQTGPDSSLTQRYLSTVIDLLASEFITPAMPDDVREDGRCVLLALEELGALGRLNNLRPLLDLGRSKGVGVLCSVQHLGQIAERYSSEFADGLASQVGTVIVTQTQAGPTRDHLAKLISERRVGIVQRASTSEAAKVDEELRPVVLSTDLTQKLGPLYDDEAPATFVIRAMAILDGDVYILDWPGMPIPRQRSPFWPAAWTLPNTSGMAPSRSDDNQDHSEVRP
jgi:hypothetical protein